VDAKKMMN